MLQRVLDAVEEYRGLFDHRVWILTGGQTMLSLGRGILFPFITIYYYNVRGFPLALVGLGFALAFPAGALVGLVWGSLSDRWGRKPLQLLGFFGSGAATALLPFVTTVPQLLAALVAQSVMSSAAGPSTRAMIADITPADRRTRAYGLTYMANNLGMSAGLVLGGFLAVLLPYRVLFFAEALGAAAYGFVILIFVAESHRPPAREARASLVTRVTEPFQGLTRPFLDRGFQLFAVAGMFAGIGWSQFYVTYGPYLKNVLLAPDAAIGTLYSINTVMVVLLQIPIAAWAERRARTRVYVSANFLLAYSLLLTWAAGRVTGVTYALGLMALGIIVMTVGEIMQVPVGAALTASLAGGRDTGKYMAALDLVFAVSGGIGSIMGGWFFDTGRPLLLWPVAATSVLVALGLYLLLGRVLPDEVNHPHLAAAAEAEWDTDLVPKTG